MIFEFGYFHLDIDVEATKAFYSQHGRTVLEDCGCEHCRNYYEAITKTSDPVKSFFSSLGIDPQKSPEATWWGTSEDGIAYYSATYHIVGTILRSIDIHKPFGDNGYQVIHENFHMIDENFKVGFTSRAVLVEKDFPQPCIQLETEAYLPWVID